MDHAFAKDPQVLRVGLQQRLLPAYRAEFFDALAAGCPGGLSILAGQPRLHEAMGPQADLKQAAFYSTHNRYLFGGPLTLVWQSGWRAWLESWRPDVLIVEANPRNLSNSQAIRWMRAHSGAVVGWGLGAPPGKGRLASIQTFWWSGLLRQYDALITYSRQGVDEYVRQGYPRERIFVAPNAATSRPAVPPPERSAIPAGRPVVLFTGRLQPRKRVDALIRACAALPVDLQPCLRIVGDGPALPDLRQLASHVYPQTEFLGDRRGADLDSIFSAADLFVLPGTGGLAVQQAMAAALPVIVAEADGTQADLVHPENGWCISPQDDSSLLRTLAEALSDLPRLRRMGAASYRIVADEINIEAMVAVFRQAIQSAAELRTKNFPAKDAKKKLRED